MAPISTSQFSAEQVHKRLRDFTARVNQTIEDAGIEAVHELRIAIRRLEPVLNVFERCFASKRVKKIRQRLKSVLALAGEVRDCDVALRVLSKASRPGIAGLRARLRTQRKKAASLLLGELELPWDMELAIVRPQRK